MHFEIGKIILSLIVLVNPFSALSIFLDCFGRSKIKERVSIGIALFYFSDGLIGDKQP